ncbi:hypothetical protein [Burkholderia sola]|uniref:hypothetical protein n=1 Tax=Burkholderia sola TaxID=2843302 RepID=UPI0023DD9FC4|nr:hypothetical protein [Burkholderia sola]MDF3086366.1 hypothetical protein [Burkholderia sola]
MTEEKHAGGPVMLLRSRATAFHVSSSMFMLHSKSGADMTATKAATVRRCPSAAKYSATAQQQRSYRQNSNTGRVSQSHTYLVNEAAVSKESRTTSSKAWQ